MRVKLPVHRENDLKDARDHERRHWHKWVTDNKQWKHLMQGYLASISFTSITSWAACWTPSTSRACGKTPWWSCGATTVST